MKLKTIHILLAGIIITCGTSASAAVLDDVRDLINAGQYAEALDLAAPVLKRSPRDAKTNYWYGRAALGAGDTDEALRTLAVAAERGYTDAYAPLIETALAVYDTDLASESIDDWRTALKKSKKAEPDALTDLESRYVRMANAIARVENIPVIAEYTIARADMDNLINRINGDNPQRGTIFGPNDKPFFVNNMTTEVFRTVPDSTGTSRLYQAGVLDDGSTENPVDLTPYIGDGDILAPFVMQDGETVYFSARRDDSLGGYDIYMTRRDGEGGFYEPTNLGMPYNSPANEYLFAIDETARIGWWITDRDAEPDSVRVLIFVPNTTRVNIDADADDVAQRARLDDITITIPDGFDKAKALAAIPVPVADQANDSDNIAPISLGNGRILTSKKDFRNPDALAEYTDMLAIENRLNDAQNRLDDMRLRYSQGDKNLKGDIRALEHDTDRLRRDLMNARNRVIRLENARSGR